MKLKAQSINCSLKRSSGDDSSTDAMIATISDAFRRFDVTIAPTLRIVDTGFAMPLEKLFAITRLPNPRRSGGVIGGPALSRQSTT